MDFEDCIEMYGQPKCQIVENITQKKLNVELAPRRAGDAEELISKADKIKEILAWTPQYNDLGYIVKSALDWEKKLG